MTPSSSSTPGSSDPLREPEPNAPAALIAELRAAYRAPEEIPPSVDAAILDAARRRSNLRRSPLRLLPAALAAAAALMLALWLIGPGATLQDEGIAEHAAPDLDGNGQVDVRDAFYLARMLEDDKLEDNKLEDNDKLDESWDVDGDGKVDQADVDALMGLAVSLSRS